MRVVNHATGGKSFSARRTLASVRISPSLGVKHPFRVPTVYHHTSTVRTNLIWMSGVIEVEGKSFCRLRFAAPISFFLLAYATARFTEIGRC